MQNKNTSKPIVFILLAFVIISAFGVYKVVLLMPPSDMLRYFEIGILSETHVPNTINEELAEELLEFCEEKNDPELWLGMTNFTADYYTIINCLRKAQNLEVENPVYPYYKGLAYAGMLKTRHMYFKHKTANDSAFVNFKRASVLDTSNAAPVFAMATTFLRLDTLTTSSSYLFRRDKKETLKHFNLQPKGKKLLNRATKKSVFRSYDVLFSQAGLKLLRSAKKNTFANREYLYKSIPEHDFADFVRTVELFSDYDDFATLATPANLTTSANLAKTKQMALLKISELAILMRRDGSGNLYQQLYATMIFDICHDLIGDLALITNDSVLVSTCSHTRAIGETWGSLWSASMTNLNPFDLSKNHHVTLYLALVLELLLVAFISLIALIATLITGSQKSKIELKPFVWILWGLLLCSLIIFISRFIGKIPAYVVSLIPILLAIDIVVNWKRKKKVVDTRVLPAYLFLLTICSLIISTWSYYPIILVIAPFAIFFATNDSFEKKGRTKGGFASLLLNHFAILFLVLSICSALLWLPSKEQLLKPMNALYYNIGFQLTGNPNLLPIDPFERFGDHYKGKQSQRIEILQEMNFLANTPSQKLK